MNLLIYYFNLKVKECPVDALRACVFIYLPYVYFN